LEFDRGGSAFAFGTRTQARFDSQMAGDDEAASNQAVGFGRDVAEQPWKIACQNPPAGKVCFTVHLKTVIHR
jgi:hypothetical protein